MSPALTLTLPMPDTLTNSGKGRSRHWRAVDRAKRQYWVVLDVHQAMGKVPPPPPAPLPRATLRSVMYVGGAMDDDNAVARHKWAIDWLRTRGYIATDRRSGLRWEAFPEQIVRRDQNYRLVLTLTPL